MGGQQSGRVLPTTHNLLLVANATLNYFIAIAATATAFIHIPRSCYLTPSHISCSEAFNRTVPLGGNHHHQQQHSRHS